MADGFRKYHTYDSNADECAYLRDVDDDGRGTGQQSNFSEVLLCICEAYYDRLATNPEGMTHAYSSAFE